MSPRNGRGYEPRAEDGAYHRGTYTPYRPWAGRGKGLVEGVAQDRLGHAPAPAPPTPQLTGTELDDFDARLTEAAVGLPVALICHNHARFDGQRVVAIVPLLPQPADGVAGLRDELDACLQGIG